MFTILSAVLLVLFCPLLAFAATVGLTWNPYIQNPENPAVGFVVERCAGETCENFVAITPAPLPLSPTAFTDASIQPATMYRWRVRAVNAQGGTSAPSNVVTFSVPLPALNAPTNLVGKIVP